MDAEAVVRTILIAVDRDAPIIGPVREGLEQEIRKFFSPSSLVLRKRSKGALVRAVQLRLNTDGQSLDVDGIYGDETFASVVQFQARRGLDPDGLCGRDTLTALFGDEQTQS